MKTESQQKLTEIKKIHGLGVAIAYKLGVTPQYVNMILTGKRNSKSVKASEVVKLAENISSALK